MSLPKPFKVLLKAAPLERSAFTLGLALVLLETLTSLSIPLLTKQLIESVTGGSVHAVLGWLICALGLQALAGAAAYDTLGRHAHAVVAKLRRALIQRCIHQPMANHENRPAGGLVSRIMEDVDALRSLLSDHLSGLLSGAIQILGSITILAILDWRLTSVLFISIAVSTLVILPLSARLRHLSMRIRDQSASLSAQLVTTFQEVRLIKAMVAENSQSRVLATEVDRLQASSQSEVRLTAWMIPFISVAFMGALVAILGYGGVRAAAGHLATGTLVAFVLYLFNVALPIIQITMFYIELQRALGCSQRVAEILSQNEEDFLPNGQTPQPRAPLTISNLKFSYPNSEAMVLDGIHLDLEPGTCTALVGPSGVGKSTLFSLLERFYEPTGGEILWGQKPIQRLKLTEWRRLIGYVAQDAAVIPGSLRDNLTVGLEKTKLDSELREALAQADALDFVNQLPEGLDTLLGERGQGLSGGQRQRLALARVWLRPRGLILLDEATAHLDGVSESVVLDSIAAWKRDSTVLVAAHRLTTALRSDYVAFMEAGKISGFGAHGHLLEHHSGYADFVRHQLHAAESLSHPQSESLLTRDCEPDKV